MLAHRLLVASPALKDPNFRRAVVLVLEHGEAGALGVIVNRPTPRRLGEVLPGWQPLAAAPAVVFVGGPVAAGTLALGLRRGEGDRSAMQEVLDPLVLVDLRADPGDLDGQIGQVRVITGYAGWASGQLEQEIAAGAWFVVDAEPEDAVSHQTEGLWRLVLARQGGVYTTVTEDPTRN